jgi:hypothetical protein
MVAIGGCWRTARRWRRIGGALSQLEECPNVDVLEVVRACQQAFARRHWSALHDLYHPDALIATVASGGRALPRAEAVAALVEASRDTVYAARESGVLRLDAQAAILLGSARERLPAGGFQDSTRRWLWTVVDGRVFRSALVPDERAGRQLYAEHGITLGIPLRVERARP